MTYKIRIISEEPYQNKRSKYIGEEEDGTSKYAYEESTEFREIEVLTQTITELDIVAVIKAVNKIGEPK